jgi:hypothetical protein
MKSTLQLGRMNILVQTTSVFSMLHPTLNPLYQKPPVFRPVVFLNFTLFVAFIVALLESGVQLLE